MTPRDIFDELLMLYPTAWKSQQQEAWAKQYQTILAGIEPHILEDAYREVLKTWTYQNPPKPADIRNVLKSPPSAKADTYQPRFPHKKRADQMMRTDPDCQQAVSEGWGLGMAEYIAMHGGLPSKTKQDHLIATNKEFWRLKKAFDANEAVTVTAKDGPVTAKINDIWGGMFNKLAAKREAVAKRYSMQEIA